jgi:DHA2 family multidrug resistance protein
MAATLMQILDTTIANVALPHMQAALGATPESVIWVLTSYIIMAAIATPITGWLETRFGRRNLFTFSVIGFTLSSAACGLATSLEMMVAARSLQGIFGAFIGPVGQATLLDSYPRHKHPQAMAIWTMGIMVGPILGPTLGGFLTEAYSWHWVFFINVPIGIAAAIGIWLLLAKTTLPRRSFDLVGFALLGLALASLQLMLDRGPQRDWFESTEILIEAGLAVGAFWMFVVHVLTTKSPVLRLALFRDHNFVIAVVFSVLIAGVMLAGAALTAPMLQVLMGHDAMSAGMLMMPRGVGVLIAMPLAGFFDSRIDSRITLAAGIGLAAASLWMMTGFDLSMGSDLIIISGVLQGIGMGLVMLPLNVVAFSTLPANLRTEGSAVFALARNIGGSVAISLMGALLAHNTQVNHAELGANLTAARFPFVQSGIIEQIGVRGEMITRLIDLEVNRQAVMIAYLDDFWIMKWMMLICLPLVLFMGRGKPATGKQPLHLE